MYTSKKRPIINHHQITYHDKTYYVSFYGPHVVVRVEFKDGRLRTLRGPIAAKLTDIVKKLQEGA